MLVKGTQKQQVTVDVDEREIFFDIERRLRTKYNIGSQQWLGRDGKLYHEEHTSHTYDVCDGPPTEDQKKCFEIIEVLRDVLVPS